MLKNKEKIKLLENNYDALCPFIHPPVKINWATSNIKQRWQAYIQLEQFVDYISSVFEISSVKIPFCYLRHPDIVFILWTLYENYYTNIIVNNNNQQNPGVKYYNFFLSYQKVNDVLSSMVDSTAICREKGVHQEIDRLEKVEKRHDELKKIGSELKVDITDKDDPNFTIPYTFTYPHVGYYKEIKKEPQIIVDNINDVNIQKQESFEKEKIKLSDIGKKNISFLKILDNIKDEITTAELTEIYKNSDDDYEFTDENMDALAAEEIAYLSNNKKSEPFDLSEM